MRIRSAIATDIPALVEFQREGWFQDYREIIPAGYAELWWIHAAKKHRGIGR